MSKEVYSLKITACRRLGLIRPVTNVSLLGSEGGDFLLVRNTSCFNQTGASSAILALDGSQVGGRQISVALSNPPARKPRQPGTEQQQPGKEQPGR